MPIDVTAFSAMARAEFMNGRLEAQSRPFPAAYDPFTTKFNSTTKVETHTYMSSLPRLAEFKGYSPGVRLTDKTYTAANKTYRIGPVTVRKDDLDDDQIGGYLRSIKALPDQGQKDIGFRALAHLAAGTTNTCFDGSTFFANSHTVGSGDNLDTANMASNDGVTHKIIALVTTNAAVKPLIFQDRESLTALQTDADTPAGMKQREFEYWADCRFGLAYGFWWDAIHLTITDTPTVDEMIETIIPQLINRFRTFTLPKGKDTDDAMYVHEGWVPDKSNLVLLINLGLAEIAQTAISIPGYSTGGGKANVYKDKALVVPTSALGA